MDPAFGTIAASVVAAPGTAAPLAGRLRRARQRFFRHAPDDVDPVVLRHSRIYILPTRRGLALIATMLVMLLTSLNYGLALGLVVTFLLAGLVSASLLHTFRNLAGIEVKPLGAGETFARGRVAYTLSLAGGTLSRLAVTLAVDGASALRLGVPADTSVPVTLEREATRRGRLPLGRVTLASDYPFGLWRGWAYVHFPLSGIVFPAPESGAPALPPGATGPDARAPGRTEDADLAGLREFQPGDPLSRVAWKAVARGGGWYTKQFDGTGGGGPVSLEWAALPGGMAVEARLERLTAWVLQAERAGRPFALRLPRSSLSAGAGRDHRRSALTALALFEP